MVMIILKFIIHGLINFSFFMNICLDTGIPFEETGSGQGILEDERVEY